MTKKKTYHIDGIKADKKCQYLLTHFSALSKQSLVYLFFRPGACIIKLITAVIYGFRNKLECLTLKPRLAGKACQGQTLYLIMDTVNYGRNKFYDTGPRVDIHKMSYELLTNNFFDGVPYK